MRQRGVPIGAFASSASFRHQARLFKDLAESIIAHVEESDLNEQQITHVIDVVTTLTVSPPEGIDPARHFPVLEYTNLTNLLLESAASGKPVPIVVPVCPDYPESGYQLGGGVGLTARRFLYRFPTLRQLFTDRGFDVSVEIDVADVEIFDPIISRRLAITPGEFFRRTSSTIEEIRRETLQRGLAQSIAVGSMRDRFTKLGVDYISRQQALAHQLLTHSGRKVRQVMTGLIGERITNDDYQDLQLTTESEFREAAAYELAGYAAYGELIDSGALICSPDAISAVPAYNLLKKDHSTVSPTAYIKPPRKEKSGLFAE